MSGYSHEIQLATSFLCSSSGSLPLLDLHRKLLQCCHITKEEFRFIVQRCPRFQLVRGPGPAGGSGPEVCSVLAKTSLRLCSGYGWEQCSGSGCCPQLHLCKFFVYGNCRFGKGRKPCKFSHDIYSDHNFRLLRECTLQQLDAEQLFVLLLQNDPALLPEVCVHYNKGGPRGGCTFQESCTKLHLCQHFVQGDCMYGLNCKRQHTINQHSRRMLEERGLSGDIIHELPVICRNIHHLTSTATEKLPDSLCQTDERKEICLHFTRNSCRFQNECRRVHFYLPYKWEVLVGVTWTDLQHMENIERDFCDPSNTQSCGDPPVDFLTMTQASRPIRRLSTVSSVTKPPHYILTTEWLWYYRRDQGSWVEYGQPDEKQRTTSVTSRTLEEKFLSDRTTEVKVVKGQRRYVVSFKDMYQRNPKHNTKRRVCRRPRFVSVAEV
ncbi:protein mono-ADP-ribosyltransferase PARP12b [Cottoperca gobio]|uniref:Protein mono-ADP-ribosyltransferase PARP12b n=1 Tax=Cottoperca gobio TaxID=56716 RepID=A0A6J2PAS5_COTGO|nr:protein mono-ADP-ribosyltransferase PARP12-like [Cottoperca gobio]